VEISRLIFCVRVPSGLIATGFVRRCTKFDQDALAPIYENAEISCRKLLEMSDSKMVPKVIEEPSNHAA
jgi:hypothetical protein